MLDTFTPLRPTAGAFQLKASIQEIVKGLLQKGVLEVESGGIAIHVHSVGVPVLIERLFEHSSTESHLNMQLSCLM